MASSLGKKKGEALRGKRRRRSAKHAAKVKGVSVTRSPARIGYESQIVDFAPVMSVWLDLSGIIRNVNRIGAKLLGARPEKLIALPFRIFVAAEHRRTFLEHLRRCRASDDAVETDIELQSRGGNRIAVRLYSRLANNRDGFPTIAIDLTEYQLLEQERQAALLERDRAEHDRELALANEAAKDLLIASVSHELRNPLSPVLAAADALSSWNGLPDQARQLAVIIKRNVELEARLINDLLDIARVTRGQLELQTKPTDIHTVILDALNTCAPAAEARGVHITIDFKAWRHHANVDDVRMRQVFWNVLSNAVKFSEPEGQILVRTTSDSANAMRVFVSDLGAGMTHDALSNLFRPFMRQTDPGGRAGGLGLGLTIAKGIVDAHGGQMRASSAGVGEGSVFEIELPTCASPALDLPAEHTDVQESQQPRTDAAPAPEAKQGARVLIVEDHQDTGMLLSMFLSQRGFVVTLAQSLAEGLRVLDRQWDVVLSDIGLGDGSGLTIARQARTLSHPPGKIIAISGFGTSRDISASHQAGFAEHLVKPVDLNRLLSVIEEAISA